MRNFGEINETTMSLKAFKAYDIRGVWGEEINAEMAYKIGFFLPGLLHADRVLVGRDCRISSDELFNALANGITDAGAAVDDAGLTTTPLIYWATAKYGYKASVMITASHNPKNHNGLKISAADALPVGYDNGLNELETKVINAVDLKPVAKGNISSISLNDAYINFLNQYVSDTLNLKIAVDCSNGMSSIFVKQLIGNHAFYINDIADGNFPGHEPNPLDAENRHQLTQLVIDLKADIGVMFDGDADRVMFIDELGNFVSPDLIIALMGHYFFGQLGQKGKVLQDIRSSRAVAEYLGQFGAYVETWRVGRAYGAGKLREIDGVFGGELAGHYYFRDFYYSDSGLMAALIVLKLVSEFKSAGFSLSALISNISSYHSTGEINFKIQDKAIAMSQIVAHFKAIETPLKFADFDGFRLDYHDWWFNVRPSNTEPYLRFIAEAKDKARLDSVVAKVTEIIQKLQ